MTTYSLTGRNGKTYTLEGPPGKTQADIEEEVLRHDPTAADPPPEKSRSLGDYIGMGGRALMELAGDTVKQVSQANPANIIGNAQEAIRPYLPDAIAKYLPRHVDPGDLAQVGVRKNADQLGLAKPETPGEKVGSEVFKGVVGALTGGGAEEVVAQKAAASAAGEAQPALMDIVRNLASKPVAGRLAAQAVAGAGSGAGGEVARQMGAPAPVQVVASLLGGLTPTVGARSLGEIADKVGSLTKWDSGEEKAASILQSKTTDVAKALNAIKYAPDATPGTTPTLTDVVQDPGLSMLQRLNPSDKLQSQEDINSIARNATASNALGAGDPTALTGLAKAKIEQGEQNVAAATEKVGPQTDRGEQGAEFRGETLNPAYKAAQARDTENYSHPILERENPVQLTTGLIGKIKQQIHDRYGNAGGDPEHPFNKIMSDLWGATGDDLSTNSKVIANVDKRLADYAGEASMRGANNEAGLANGVRQQIADATNSQLPPNFIRQLAKAKAGRRDTAVRFEEGQVGELTNTDRYGSNTVSDVTLPERLTPVNAKGGELADQLIAAVGPRATEANIRQELRRRIDAGDIPSLDVAGGGMGELIKRFPGLKDDVQALHEHIALNDAFKDTPLGQMADTSTSPTARVHQLINANDDGVGLQHLIDSVKKSGNPDAVSGLQRALGDYVVNNAKTDTLASGGTVHVPSNVGTHAAISNLLDKAGDILTPQQKTTLQVVKNELGKNIASETQGTTMYRRAEEFNLPLEGWKVRAIKGALQIFGGKDKVAGVIDQALRDPKFAATLLDRAAPDRIGKIRRAARQAAKASFVGAIPGIPSGQPGGD